MINRTRFIDSSVVCPANPPADVAVRRMETLSRSIVRGTSNVKNVAPTDFVIQWRLTNEASGEEPRLS